MYSNLIHKMPIITDRWYEYHVSEEDVKYINNCNSKSCNTNIKKDNSYNNITYSNKYQHVEHKDYILNDYNTVYF